MAQVALPGPPPKEALEYFRQKGLAIGFSYQDVWREEHAAAFTVAKAMEVEVLEAIRGAVDRALANGQPFERFAAELRPELERLGWWGIKEMTDPATGEVREVQLGSVRRLRTIYDVNLRTARAAGAWERIQRTKRALPYLEYNIGPSKVHRELHVSWAKLVLHADDPWWQVHFPPNGWGCNCWVRQLGKSAAEALGIGTAPPDRLVRWTNRRTGEVLEVPAGIDPGFDYNPGIARMRAFTPPPEGGGLPRSAPVGGEPPAPPPARELAPSRILPASTSVAEAVGLFLAQFGATPGRAVVHVDPIGQPLVVGEEMFRGRSGELELGAAERASALVLADVIKDPDEIWWVWERLEGGDAKRASSWTLRRRYLARWLLEGRELPVAVGFELGKTGWRAAAVAAEAGLDALRAGLLAYRRK